MLKSKTLEWMIIIILVLYSLMAMAYPVYPTGYVKKGDPYDFAMDLSPRIIEPYDPVYGIGIIYYVFPYPLPVPLEYRLEIDFKAKKPWNVIYHDMPPKPWRSGSPVWVPENYVRFYESGVIYRHGSGELWVSFYTTTAYFYDQHWTAVGDKLSTWWIWNPHEKNWFWAENLPG